MPSTETLVQSARRSPKAFELLVERFQAMAVAYALGRLNDPALALEATQDAFIEAWQKLDQLREDAAFAGWLRRILHTRCTRILRRQRPDPTADVELHLIDPAPDTDDALAAAEREAWLEASVEQLPDGHRRVVALHYLAGLPVADVAAFLELPPTTVKKRLFDARLKLRASLEGVLRRYGIQHAVETVIAPVDAARDARRSLVQTSLERVRELATHGPVAVFLFEEEGTSAWVDAGLPRCAEVAELTFVVRPWGAVTREERAPTGPIAPFTAAIQTSRAMADQGIWPALDPEGTRRRGPELDALREDAVGALSHTEHPVRDVLVQPFWVVEADTGAPGTWVSCDTTRAAVAGALAPAELRGA